MPWYLGREQLTEMGGQSADLPVEPEQPEPEGFCIYNSMCIYSQTFSRNDKGSAALNYHWRDLLQVLFLSRRRFRVFFATKQVFCRDAFVATNIFIETKKNWLTFFATNTFLSQQAYFCCDKDRFYLDKSKLVATNIIVNKQNDTCGSSRQWY